MARAFSRKTNEMPPASLTPPWQAVHWVVRMGRMSRLKSISSASAGRVARQARARVRKGAGMDFLGELIFRRCGSR